MTLRPAEERTFPVRLDGRYLLHVPEVVDAKTLLVLTLHGYSSNPEAQLRLTRILLGERQIIASLQAPNQHYTSSGLPNAQSESGYNWGIRGHWEASVRLHHEMVLGALADLRKRFGLAADRCLLMGFSQPVGLNYRFIGTFPREIGGIIGICGGVPRDWSEDKYQIVNAPILHISRDQDEFYPNEAVLKFPELLKKHATDVEFHLIAGTHRFPSKASTIVDPWLARAFGSNESLP